MGSIIERKRADGTIGYRAQIILKKDGKIVHREAKTFDRRQAAAAWLEHRERDLAKPGALEHREDPTLADVIDKYTATAQAVGRSKAQALRAIKTYSIANLRCSQIDSSAVVELGQQLRQGDGIERSPATVLNYIWHLGAVFRIARPAWRYPLDPQAVKDAYVVLSRLGVVAKSRRRERRPTIAELDLLMDYFSDPRRRSNYPMTQIILFAIFSCRRLEEITRIRWSEFEPAHGNEPARVMVRGMKDPFNKATNDQRCDLPAEAARIIAAMPKDKPEIFPFSPRTIGTYFTNACAFLEIVDLHFHDLRHDGISRLFEIGMPIANVAAVSGHRQWHSLQRYTHIRQIGDKYADWKWKP